MEMKAGMVALRCGVWGGLGQDSPDIWEAGR